MKKYELTVSQRDKIQFGNAAEQENIVKKLYGSHDYVTFQRDGNILTVYEDLTELDEEEHSQLNESLLIDNQQEYKDAAKKYFEGRDTQDSFLYRVATDFMLYDLSVPYYNDDFERSLKALYEKNLGSQLTEVFKDKFGFSFVKYLNDEGIAFKRIYTDSDAGSVKIGNETMTINIPNGYGDGQTDVFIVEKKKGDNVRIPYDFLTTVKGTFNIYEYDCGNGEDAVVTISGEYAIYFENGVVVFEKWEE